MNMKKWTTPMAMEESFTANVDVAVSTCYIVACDAKSANAYEIGHLGDDPLGLIRNHKNVNCTFPEKNVIQIDQTTHKITGMIGEYSNGDVPCQFTDSNYQPINPGELEVGKRVYWTHQGLLGTYHHQGDLKLSDPNKKCMS